MLTVRKLLLSLCPLLWLTQANAAPLPDAVSVAQLQNGATLGSVSRPLRGTAIVALQFNSGSFQDSVPGLAHLAEHLFLRSPLHIDGETVALRDFLSLHGGRQDARTSHENTRFYFEVNASVLNAFLTQLTHMIQTPAFTQVDLASELAAIDDEFSFLKTKLTWRLHDALKAAAPEAHPFRRFKAGNRESYSQYRPDHLLKLARDFIQRHYQASGMAVLVVAPASTGEIEAAIRSTLGHLPPGKSPTTTVSPLIDRAKLPLELRINEAVSQPQLNLMFPLNDIAPRRAEAAIVQLQHWARANGESSWRRQLIDTGLVNEVRLGRGLSTVGESTLRVTLSLSSTGRSQRPALVALVAQSLQALAEQAAREPITLEEDDLPTIINQQLVQHWLAQLAAPDTHTQAPEQPIDRSFIARLNRNNVLAILIDGDIDGEQRSPVFDVAYTLAPMRYPDQAATGLALTPFSAGTSEEKDAPPAPLAKSAERPRQLLQSPMLTAWHASNTVAGDGILLKLSLTLPTTNDTLANRVLWSVWYRDLQRFTQNGEDSRWHRHTRGARIEMRGSVAQLQQKLISLSAWLNRPLSEDEFFNLKQTVIEDWRTPPRYRFAFQALVDRLKEVVLLNEDAETVKLTALQPLQRDRLVALRTHSLQSMQATLFVYGASEEQAQQLTKTFEQHAPVVTLVPTQAEDGQQRTEALLSPQEFPQQQLKVALPGRESALLHYQQLPKALPADEAKYRLLLPLIRRQYFSAIREQQKLAYGVTVVPVALDDQRGIAFIAQSANTPPDRLRAATRDFLRDFPIWLDKLPEETLERLKHSVREELQSSPKQGEQLADHYWSQITNGRLETNWNHSVREALTQVDRAALARYCQSALALDKAIVLEGWRNQG